MDSGPPGRAQASGACVAKSEETIGCRSSMRGTRVWATPDAWADGRLDLCGVSGRCRDGGAEVHRCTRCSDGRPPSRGCRGVLPVAGRRVPRVAAVTGVATVRWWRVVSGAGVAGVVPPAVGRLSVGRDGVVPVSGGRLGDASEGGLSTAGRHRQGDRSLRRIRSGGFRSPWAPRIVERQRVSVGTMIDRNARHGSSHGHGLHDRHDRLPGQGRWLPSTPSAARTMATR
jgi:hypothetical protein